MEPLTERQQLVLDCIKQYQLEHGYAPSIRDLIAATDIDSPNGIICHLKALVKKGWIKTTPHVARSIVVLDPPCVT